MKKELHPIATEALLKFSMGQISKEDLKKELDRASNEKRKKCIRKDGTFDYLKMSEMYHSGKW